MADQTRVGDRASRDTGSTGGEVPGNNGKARPRAAGSAAEEAPSVGATAATGRAGADTATSERAAPTVAPGPGGPASSTGTTRVSRSGDGPRSEPAPHSTGSTPSLTAPLQRLTRPRGQIRARKVHRIVRRVDPWSVLKLSLIFYLCVWVMVIIAVVLLWGVAVGSGAVASVENFIAEFLAFEEFSFNGDQLFQIFALGGLIGVFVATAVTAILSVLFNLIADLTGGIRFTVVEEESARRLLPQDAAAGPQR